MNLRARFVHALTTATIGNSRSRLRQRIAELEQEIADLGNVIDAVERDRLKATAARDRATQSCDAAIREVVAVRTTLVHLVEPADGTTCGKVRLSCRTCAITAARRVEDDTGCGPLEPYPCSTCPPRFRGERWWHVAHRDPRDRGGNWRTRPFTQDIPDAIIRKVRNRIDNEAPPLPSTH